MKILSIDPGGTTGLAVRVPTPDYNDERILTTVVETACELLDWVWPGVGGTRPWDLVIVENFQTQALLDANGHYTIELIGAVKALCTAHKISYVVQMPHYRISSLAAARQWHIDNAAACTAPKPLVKHATDALAHLFAYEEKGPPKPMHSVREMKWREE